MRSMGCSKLISRISFWNRKGKGRSSFRGVQPWGLTSSGFIGQGTTMQISSFWGLPLLTTSTSRSLGSRWSGRTSAVSVGIPTSSSVPDGSSSAPSILSRGTITRMPESAKSRMHSGRWFWNARGLTWNSDIHFWSIITQSSSSRKEQDPSSGPLSSNILKTKTFMMTTSATSSSWSVQIS